MNSLNLILSPLKDFHTFLVHRQVATSFWLAQTFTSRVIDYLAKEPFLRVETKMIWIIHNGRDFEEALQVVHHIDRIRLELLAVNYV